MTGLDALQSVQFVTKNGKRLAVLDAEDWEALIEWLETLEDTQIVQQATAELKTAKGNRRRAGGLGGTPSRVNSTEWLRHRKIEAAYAGA